MRTLFQRVAEDGEGSRKNAAPAAGCTRSGCPLPANPSLTLDGDRFVDGLSDEQVEALFAAARDADYARIAEEARGREITFNSAKYVEAFFQNIQWTEVNRRFEDAKRALQHLSR